MKKIIISLTTLCLVLLSCSTGKKATYQTIKLEGSWELNYISGSKIDFDKLYPNKKPIITFDSKDSIFSGNAGCNNYNGKLSVWENKISFKKPIAVTRMMCSDVSSENIYLTTLEKIDSFSISKDGKTLNLISGEIKRMRLVKK
ncbi:META domain-containing protein [Flavobacterium sp. LB2R40]|uniref:META domain-containing protein n=1 Tax=Flavobacterium sp. LB2R40 TaxID=3401722 RepID=UPI003AAC365E